jgi:hypothetical protein
MPSEALVLGHAVFRVSIIQVESLPACECPLSPPTLTKLGHPHSATCCLSDNGLHHAVLRGLAAGFST